MAGGLPDQDQNREVPEIERVRAIPDVRQRPARQQSIQSHAPWRQPGKNDQAGSDHGQQRGVARELAALTAIAVVAYRRDSGRV